MHYLAVISAHAKSTEPVYSDTSLRFLQAGRVARCARSLNARYPRPRAVVAHTARKAMLCPEHLGAGVSRAARAP